MSFFFLIFNLKSNLIFIFRFRRDTSSYKHIKQTYCEGKTPSLKKLANIILNRTIQEGEHDSVIDAKTALEIYKKFQDKWESDASKKK